MTQTAPPPPADAVCAVLVAYQADLAVLDKVLTAIISQVDGLVLVDNGMQTLGFEARMAIASAQGVKVLRYPDNPGLAAGLNHGIEYARRQGFSFVLLLDQDSIATPCLVEHLLAGYRQLSAHKPIAAVGPQWVDSRTQAKAPFIRICFPFNLKIDGAVGQPVACDFLISSGSLIPLPVLEKIGSMDESLFIDDIDTDWCMRATMHGYALYGLCNVTMQHTLGDRVKTLRWPRRTMFIHSPLRQYYSTRNRIRLYRRAHVPWSWVVQDVPRLFIKCVLMTFLTSPRRPHFRAIWRGVLDGLRGRGGRAQTTEPGG